MTLGASRCIERALPNASRGDRNGTIGVCVPFIALSSCIRSQSPIIELLTPRDSFKSPGRKQTFSRQIPSLVRFKNNSSALFSSLSTNYVRTLHTFLPVFQIPLFFYLTRTRILVLSLSLSLFPFNIR